MKTQIVKLIAMAVIMASAGCSDSERPETWSNQKINTWFEKGEWLNGWQVKPDESINRKAFAISYFKNPERWNKAFGFMKNNNLQELEVKRYEIDGNNVYALVSEYLTKNEENARYEAHRKFIDIQYVISGREQIGIAPLSARIETLEPYSEANDIEFLTVKDGVNHLATPDRFFIFFPDEAHRPGLKDGENSTVKKIVVKVKID
ncbi:MAG: YhcH/YjgK/YiaL family protein [Bacteroidales bacterium]